MKRIIGALRLDIAGNVLAIAAASVIPLVALIGCGIDISRAYMAQSRLQMACDAGALAGRRVMKNGVFDDTVRDEALKFFRFNFPTGENGKDTAFKVNKFTPVAADGGKASVTITAATAIPTTLMSMFGYDEVALSVNCFARQDFVNTDIVLVLDTTGSMNDKAVSSDPINKIAGLRAAVLALYDQLKPVQDQLEAVGLRLRYGLVPYSITTNVGDAIRSVDKNYLVDNWDYQSRVANFNDANYVGTAGTPAVTTEQYATAITSLDCVLYGKNLPFIGFAPSPAGNSTTGARPANETSTVYTAGTWGGSATISGLGLKTCVRNKTVTTTTFITNYKFTSWTYKQANYNVSNFRDGNSITLATDTAGTMPAPSGPDGYTAQQLAATGTGFATTASTWDGCVEERDTKSTITSASGLTPPSDAYDLDIDLVPSSKETRWRSHWPDVVYLQTSTTPKITKADSITSQGGNAYACPTQAKRLQAWTRSDLSDYLNSLTPNGFTYHDIGMIWGARFISPSGIFKASSADLSCGSTDTGNSKTYCSMPVTRYIIYMTDGALVTQPAAYTAYGVEYLDKRVTGGYTTDSDQASRHNQRLLMACQAAKEKGTSIWVIAFASSLSTQLKNCATTPAQASVSSDSATLVKKFVEIGKNIGALRLTQ